MKKTTLLSMLAATVLFSACNSDMRQIKKNAMGYIIATSNYNIDEAMVYASKKTREETLPTVRKVLMPLVDSSFLAKNVPATAAIDSIELYEDTAIVYYTKTTPLSTSNGELTVIKEDGNWLVDVVLDLASEQ